MALDVTVLAEDRPGDPTLTGERGLSLLVRGQRGALLFDTGASGEVLLRNADTLRVDLSTVHEAVLSHGHADHAGGLGALTERSRPLRLYCGVGAFAGRYEERPGRPLESIGVPFSRMQLTSLGVTAIEIDSPTRLSDDVIVSGPIGGPAWGPQQFAVRRDDELVRDTFADELFVMIHGRQGWVVLTGCCHRGPFNTLRLARFLAHDECITAVVGGLHLPCCRQEQLCQIAQRLDQVGRPDLYLGHCTGQEGLDFLITHYEGQVHPIAVGTRLKL